MEALWSLRDSGAPQTKSLRLWSTPDKEPVFFFCVFHFFQKGLTHRHHGSHQGNVSLAAGSLCRTSARAVSTEVQPAADCPTPTGVPTEVPVWAVPVDSPPAAMPSGARARRLWVLLGVWERGGPVLWHEPVRCASRRRCCSVPTVRASKSKPHSSGSGLAFLVRIYILVNDGRTDKQSAQKKRVDFMRKKNNQSLDGWCGRHRTLMTS